MRSRNFLENLQNANDQAISGDVASVHAIADLSIEHAIKPMYFMNKQYCYHGAVWNIRYALFTICACAGLLFSCNKATDDPKAEPDAQNVFSVSGSKVYADSLRIWAIRQYNKPYYFLLAPGDTGSLDIFLERPPTAGEYVVMNFQDYGENYYTSANQVHIRVGIHGNYYRNYGAPQSTFKVIREAGHLYDEFIFDACDLQRENDTTDHVVLSTSLSQEPDNGIPVYDTITINSVDHKIGNKNPSYFMPYYSWKIWENQPNGHNLFVSLTSRYPYGDYLLGTSTDPGHAQFELDHYDPLIGAYKRYTSLPTNQVISVTPSGNGYLVQGQSVRLTRETFGGIPPDTLVLELQKIFISKWR